eukprot:scaffold15.g4303.t1
MRPFILQGHSRPLNQVKFNTEGDFFVTCAKDNVVNLWWSDNGTRGGTFNGHNGTVWSIDLSYDSTRLLTAGGDSTVRLWDMRNGQELYRFAYQGDNAPFRAVRFSVGEQLVATSTDPFMSRVSQIRLLRMAEDPAEQSSEVIRALEGCKGRISRLEFTDLNRTLISASEDGYVRRWDVETGKVKEEAKIHDKHIADLQMAVDGTHFVTASNDKSAKLVDTQTLEVLKTYQSTVPVNSAALSPIYDHVLIGGGQEASQIYEEEFANVRGHFGPINAVSFSPDGTQFVSGGEEGYIRLHTFDADYFTLRL